MLLEIRDLETKFYTVDGIVNAVNGISYAVDSGECLAIVGESGSGKSVGALSILRLIPSPPGRIVGGQILFKGTDLLTLSDDELRRIRGRAISIIFQDPMTSLNPVMRVGRQITEALTFHLGLSQRQAQRCFGWGRDTLRKAQNEARSGITCHDATSCRGRKPAEFHLPRLLDDITAIAQDHCQTDPTFHTTRLYCRLTAAADGNVEM